MPGLHGTILESSNEETQGLIKMCPPVLKVDFDGGSRLKLAYLRFLVNPPALASGL